jgi:hypothetical protein
VRKPSKELGPLVDVDRLLAVEKLHITHKNSLAIGTKREVVYGVAYILRIYGVA